WRPSATPWTATPLRATRVLALGPRRVPTPRSPSCAVGVALPCRQATLLRDGLVGRRVAIPSIPTSCRGYHQAGSMDGASGSSGGGAAEGNEGGAGKRRRPSGQPPPLPRKI